MIREFIYLQNFDRIWNQLGFSDDDLVELENMILKQPDKGELIQETGGLRKIRTSMDNKGKSGGIHVLYVDFEFYERTYFLFAYLKSEMETITPKQKQMFRKLIADLLNEIKQKRVKR